jgi:hypothetical protein
MLIWGRAPRPSSGAQRGARPSDSLGGVEQQQAVEQAFSSLRLELQKSPITNVSLPTPFLLPTQLRSSTLNTGQPPNPAQRILS